MVEVARGTSTTMPMGALAVSPGVNATWTRISPLRYLRGRGDDLLPAPEPGNRRVVLRVRPRDLPGLHGLRPGRDPVPRSRGAPAGYGASHQGCPPRRLRGHWRARHEGVDRAQRP